MYVAIGLALVFLLVVARCCLCRRKAQSSDKKEPKSANRRDKSKLPPTAKPTGGLLARAAHNLYASLPMASPPGTPQRPRAHFRNRSSNRGDDSYSTDEEEHDLESCRTPPRRGKGGTQARTPPCTLGTPETEGVRSPRAASSRQGSTMLSEAEATKEVVIVHDVMSPNGQLTRQATRVLLPVYADSTPPRAAPTSPKKVKASTSSSPSPRKKAFPQLMELAQRSAAKEGIKPPRPKHVTCDSSEVTEGPSVSTMSCSVSTPTSKWRMTQQHPSAPPQSHSSCTQPGMASPGSESSLPSAKSPHKAKKSTSRSTPRGSPSKRALPPPLPPKRSGAGEWSAHVHSSGRVFYHNDRYV